MIVGCMNANDEEYLGYSIASFIHVVDKLVIGLGPELSIESPTIALFKRLYPDKVLVYDEDDVMDIEGGFGEMKTRLFQVIESSAIKMGWRISWLLNPDADHVFYNGIYDAPEKLRTVQNSKSELAMGNAEQVGIVRTRQWILYPDNLYVPLHVSDDKFHCTYIHFIRWLPGMKYNNKIHEALAMPPGFSGQIIVPNIDFVHFGPRCSDEEMLAKMIRYKKLEGWEGTEEEIEQKMLDDKYIPADKKGIIRYRRETCGGHKLEKFTHPLPDAMQGYVSGNSNKDIKWLEEYVKENEQRKIKGQ